METFIGIIVILAIAILLIKKYKPSWYELAKTYITNTIKSNKKTTKKKQQMAYLISNIPHFKCWVRREFTTNHQKYHGEFLHAIAIAVNTIPDRSLSFQVVFTGCEADGEEDLSLIHI